MENVITLGKLFSQWFCFLLLFLKLQPLNVHTKNSRNEIARPVMGTIFSSLVNMLGTCLGTRWQTRQVESLQNWKEVNVVSSA